MLKGIRVLDLSRLLPGPYASLMLADMGAEVIKVEDTIAGDYIRDFEPKEKELSAYYLSVNRNKKSIRLNLKTEQGKKIFMELVKESDVVLETFRAGVMEKLGLGYEVLKEVNPGIVMCAITSFGQTGFLSEKAGHDVNFTCLSGISYITGVRDGRPVFPGVQIGDLSAAMFAVIGIQGGLLQKKMTGKGCYIDTSMTDGLLSWMAFYMAEYNTTRKELERGKIMLSGGMVGYSIYETKDNRHIAIGAVEYKFWDNFCQAIGKPEYSKYHMNDTADEDEGYELVKAEVKKRTLTEWKEILQDVDCCFTPVCTVGEAFNSDLVKERDLLVEYEHPTEGKLQQIGFPLKITNYNLSQYKIESKDILPPPHWGQNTVEILKEIGYTQKEIEEMKNNDII